jgi:hypothetical protein
MAGYDHYFEAARIRVSVDGDRGRARRRYLRASKADLVNHLLVAEQA